MDEVVVERVLRAVEQVPRGRLVAYGDIARMVGIGARHVGWIMRHWGANVPWWRVVNVAGRLPDHLVDEAAMGVQIGDGLGSRIALWPEYMPLRARRPRRDVRGKGRAQRRSRGCPLATNK